MKLSKNYQKNKIRKFMNYLYISINKLWLNNMNFN